MTEPSPVREEPGSPAHRGSRHRLAAAFAARLRTYRDRAWGWRVAVPLVFVTAGLLFVTSSVTAGGNDLRGGRYSDLPGLAEAQAREVERLRGEQNQLTRQVERLTRQLSDTRVGRAQRRATQTSGPAGLRPAQGQGLTVTLTDAPEAVLDSAETDVNNLVVHQQDIQAVVNALWAGGAEAMTVQGQRVVSTTGIRCVGNTVVLHDVPYAPPYVISAIGPTGQMRAGLRASEAIGYYLEAVSAYQLGWEVDRSARLRVPAYDGPTELSHARPADGT